MKCPHCNIEIHEDWRRFQFELSGLGTIDLKQHRMVPIRSAPAPRPRALFSCDVMKCPSCTKAIAYIKADRHFKDSVREGFVFPRSISPFSLSDDISSDENLKELVEIYYEVQEVLPISPKASAALSRRILQTILEKEGYKEKNLANQIDSVVKEANPERSLPSHIRETVDYIRNVGNFAAHSITDKNTLEIIDVELEEAEWCLEIVRRLFDHYYVQPAISKGRMAALNEKLEAAGKKPSK